VPKFLSRTGAMSPGPARRYEFSRGWLKRRVHHSCLVAAVITTLFGLGTSVLGQSELAAKSGDQGLLLGDAAISAPKDLKVSPPGGNLLSEAALLYRAGRLDAALEKYKLMLQAAPNSPPAYAGVSRIYLKQGNVEGAAETVNQGLALSNSEDLRVALGEIYFRRGQIPEAEREWTNVVNSSPANARAYLGLARVRNALSLHAQSKAMVDKARALDPIDPDIELEWNNSLPLADRISRLESYLNSPEGAQAPDRANGQHYLDYLKMLANPAGDCQLVQARDSAEFPMLRILTDSEHVRGFGIRVNVNDRKAKLMLDTGTSGILISRQLAEKAHLPKLAESRIRAVGERVEIGAYMTIAGSVKIGDLEFRDCPVRVLENRSPVVDEGLIGADFFEHFLVNLDFPQQKLQLSVLPKRPPGGLNPSIGSAIRELQDRYVPREMDSYTRAYRFGSYLLIPTQVGDKRDKLFVLDTGGLQSQITPGAAREITRLRGVSDTTVTGINGRVKNVYSADNISLQFGNLPQQSRSLISFDLTNISNDRGTEISGILGFDLLQSLDIKIDYRDALVDFQ
jgi:tetratricopeptide (TPR) repeat protein